MPFWEKNGYCHSCRCFEGLLVIGAIATGYVEKHDMSAKAFPPGAIAHRVACPILLNVTACTRAFQARSENKRFQEAVDALLHLTPHSKVAVRGNDYRSKCALMVGPSLTLPSMRDRTSILLGTTCHLPQLFHLYHGDNFILPQVAPRESHFHQRCDVLCLAYRKSLVRAGINP